MRTNRLAFLLLAIFTIIILACDPLVEYNKVIQNDSDYDLNVKIYPESKLGYGSLYESDSFQIVKHTESSIYEFSSLGQTFEYEDCNTYADSIFVKVRGNDTLQLIINLNDKANWVFSVLDKTYKKGGTCECRVRITNEMIK